MYATFLASIPIIFITFICGPKATRQVLEKYILHFFLYLLYGRVGGATIKCREFEIFLPRHPTPSHILNICDTASQAICLSWRRSDVLMRMMTRLSNSGIISEELLHGCKCNFFSIQNTNNGLVTTRIVILNVRNLCKLWQEIYELFIWKCAR